MLFAFLFPILLFWSAELVHGDTEVYLSPIVKEGTPGEVLLDDPIVPANEGNTALNSGSGSVQNSIQNQTSLNIVDTGQPGGLAQVKGVGPFAEDIDVQAFGLSLSPPQGGGYSFSVFPQFLWSEFKFNAGPTLNAMNPTSVSGTLTLIPWTSKALSRESQGKINGHITEFYSDAGLNQISVAGGNGKNLAAVAGYSSSKVKGPSAGFSSVWGDDQYSGAFHLLASNLDSESPGSTDFPSPRASLQTSRVIPILQNDFKFRNSTYLKTSFYYDSYHLNYSDLDSPVSNSENHTKQWGGQSSYFFGDWKLGLSGRQVDYSINSSFRNYSVPVQSFGHFQVSREFQFGTLLIEPLFQSVWVTSLGVLPQGSFGVRYEWNQGHHAIYSRTSLSRRVPTLQDRFAIYSDFVGNPNLKPELNWTEVLGLEWKYSQWEASVQGQAQLRNDPRVFTGATVINLDQATLYALTGTASVSATHFLKLFHSMTFSQSKLLSTGREFPYVPGFRNVVGAQVHGSEKSFPVSGSVSYRTSSSQLYSIYGPERLPGYGVVDTGVQWTILKKITIAGRVENLFDRSYQLVKGYPLGRIMSFMLIGEL